MLKKPDSALYCRGNFLIFTFLLEANLKYFCLLHFLSEGQKSEFDPIPKDLSCLAFSIDREREKGLQKTLLTR